MKNENILDDMALLQSLGTIPNPTYVPYHCIFKRYMYLNNVNIIPPSRNKENGWVAEVKERNPENKNRVE